MPVYSIYNEAIKIASRAREAKGKLSGMSASKKDAVLQAMADLLLKTRDYIIKENAKDIKEAGAKKLSKALIDRLILDKSRIITMSNSLREIAALDNPLGEIIEMRQRPNGLKIGKLRIPIGVILIIYEARPNVTSDCIGLCLKSGNALILRGGSEALNSNIAIYKTLSSVSEKAGFPSGAINMVMTKDRKIIGELLSLTEYIDLCIPRGGESLINEIAQSAKIPVIKHYKGVCHTYVDKYASVDMALNICYNAKVQRPGVCNAMETLLVHKDIASRFLPLTAALYKKANVELRGCAKTRKILKGIKEAKEADWYEEYLDLILSIKIVDNLDEAISHITKYGSSHSDAIVTNHYEHAMEFLHKVDSACVYVNASTRFTDGGQFGFGAEIGISTEKLHVRGPMGLKELMTYKYIIFGSGQVRE
ncbi:MAG: glutamate-5-semialdehyde dehydrogenase [Candidatus Omnitrophota bacterium]